MSLLNRVLGKLGVTYEELNEEEKRTFNSWREALSGRSLTDSDVAAFLDTEYHETVKKLTSSPTLDVRTDTFLKMKLDMIIKIKDFLATPIKERNMVEQHIQAQLSN